MLGLELGKEYECSTSRSSHVDWALIDGLVFLTLSWKWSGSAVDDWADTVKLLWKRLVKLSNR